MITSEKSTNARRATRPSFSRLARYGLPLAATAVIATACSSSGSTSTPAANTGSTPASAASTSAAAATTVMLTSGSTPHLVDSSGKSLYLWVADTAGKSTCTAACATAWPPVTATGTPTAGMGLTAGKLSTVKRDDGSSQVTYAGHPLYYFVQDTAAGDEKGQGSDGFGAKWWLLDGAGTAITTAADDGPATSFSATSDSGVVPGY
ncbi:MAG: hypothetical protein JWN95_3247 [Frankiales bacterium]|nr:hypothetical protein [Frankiales bacterium]